MHFGRLHDALAAVAEKPGYSLYNVGYLEELYIAVSRRMADPAVFSDVGLVQNIAGPQPLMSPPSVPKGSFFDSPIHCFADGSTSSP